MPVIRDIKIRMLLRRVIPFIIPCIIIAGAVIFEGKRYSYISFAIAVLAVILFISGYEKKKIGTRRMIITAIMTALAVTGRFIPLFKPVTAMTIITGMYLGGEAGFLTGALSAVISNFYFGQGPWTPFQMLGWGIIGMVAGVLAEYLIKHRTRMVAYGVLSGILFSFIMDIWTVLWYNETLDGKLYLMAIMTAIPFTVLYALSNAVFLLVLGRPFGEKLMRIRRKYGI